MDWCLGLWNLRIGYGKWVVGGIDHLPSRESQPVRSTCQCRQETSLYARQEVVGRWNLYKGVVGLSVNEG